MARRPSLPYRGCVYHITAGHEIRSTRPAVVFSNDHMNETAATILVRPITPGLPHTKLVNWKQHQMQKFQPFVWDDFQRMGGSYVCTRSEDGEEAAAAETA